MSAAYLPTSELEQAFGEQGYAADVRSTVRGSSRFVTLLLRHKAGFSAEVSFETGRLHQPKPEAMDAQWCSMREMLNTSVRGEDDDSTNEGREEET